MKKKTTVNASKLREIKMARQSALINLIWSSFGAIFCFVAAVVYMVVYHNYNAGLWVISAGILSMLCFHLHLLQYLNKLEQYYPRDSLQLLDYGGLAACLVGFGFLCWNLTRIVTWKQDGKEDDEVLYYIAGYSVANFILMMFGLYVKISVMIYLEAIKQESRPIIGE